MKKIVRPTLIYLGLLLLIFQGCDSPTTRRIDGGQGPTPPTRLTARFVTATQIRLDWHDNAIDEDGFDVFEATGVDSNFFKLTSAPANVEFKYLDNHRSNLKYYFKVRAFSSTGFSAFSNVFMLEGGSMLARMKLAEGTMRCAAFSHDGERVATGSGDYKVRMWDWSTESETRRYLTHERAVLNVSFSPGGGRLASSDDIQTVVWDLNSGQYHTSFLGIKAKYSPDGRYLALYADSLVKLLDPTTFDLKQVLRGARDDYKFSADGRWVVSKGDSLRKFDLSMTADTLDPAMIYNRYFQVEDTLHRFGQSLQGTLYAISPDAKQALIGSLYLNIADSSEIRRISEFAGTTFAISPDGKKLVSGTTDWKVILWDMDTGQRLRTLSGHEYSVYSVSWSPNGAFVVSASGDGSARVWGPFD